MCKESKLEKETRAILNEYGYGFESQVWFDDLLGYSAVPLKFDFALVDESGEIVLIECQGIQHEKATDFRGEGIEKAQLRFERQKEYDKMKKDYCVDKGYKLVEVWYYEDVLTSLKRQSLCLNKQKPLG